MAEIVTILKVFAPVKDYVFGSVTDYVGYIGSYEENLGTLHKTLDDLCNMKDVIEKKVTRGNDKLEEITRVAASWLQDVRVLADDEVLKVLIYKDIDTAKFVVKMMGAKDLKRRLSKDTEMQEVAVKVMKKLKEEMEESEDEMRNLRIIKEVDYKKVAEVVIEVLKDTIEKFKRLMKEDKKMAVIATRTLKGRDLDKLIEGDLEMEEIFRQARNGSDEELLPNHEDVESNALLLNIPVVDSNKNRVKEAAKNLFTPLENLLTPLGKLMDDATFKKAVPEAEAFKLGLDVIDGLFVKNRGMNKEMNENTQQHRGCCCSSLSLCKYHERYQISKAAKNMAEHICDDIISKCPLDPVTLPIRAVDLKPIPTQFLKTLESRTKLLDQILENLNNDQVSVIGVYGMGGTGKTTLAKEVNNRVKDLFNLKAMVEVSDAPDIVRIQATIANSIDLQLQDVVDVGQRAVKLYNRLSEKEKKVLIILDNVWNKLNLDEIGIPSTCKLLLTTREKEVCRVMGVQEVNIHKVDLMTPNEGRELFRSQVGNQLDIEKYKNVVERLLSKCGGLPLTIVATINSLKDKDLSSWEKFADEIEKPISSQISGDYRHIYAILGTSYKFIEVEEKRILFLLACLSHVGSSTSVESLMRFGIGLNLFKHVNKLSEAMKQADTWVNELVLSSMLVEGDVKGEVKVHDIVREFAISFAAKEERHEFMVEDIPRWMDDDSLKKYTAMSLMSMDNCSCLREVKSYKLQILILKGDLSSNYNYSFFEGMVNLKVLALSNIKFQPSLPKSMRKLKKLRTLCMERCYLGEIKQIGELVNLLVLSLRESVLEQLPDEIGKLRKLRLLDLSRCTCIKEPLIPSVVLVGLSKLEGLYTISDRLTVSVFEKKVDDEEMSAVENRLPYLNVFENHAPEVEDLIITGQSLQNVEKFRVSVGQSPFSVGQTPHSDILPPNTQTPHSDILPPYTRTPRSHNLLPYSRILSLQNIDNLKGVLVKSNLKVLLKKADSLIIKDSDISNIVPEFDQEGFKDLDYLGLTSCRIKCIVDGHGINNLIVFRSLRSLCLQQLDDLEMICDDEVQPGMFSNLQALFFKYLDKLRKGLPLVPHNLIEIKLEDCKLLNFIFTEDDDDDEESKVIELRSLKSLILTDMPHLLGLVGPKKLSTTNHAFSDVFFDGKIAFPSLELFQLCRCNNVVKLWNTKVNTCGFQNLKEVRITACDKLLNVGPFYVFSVLVKLETLLIQFCDEMREIVSFEETGESAIDENIIIKFPELKDLAINFLPNLERFYAGKSKLEFPKLKELRMLDLDRMKSFAKLENSSALFHEMISFPCLEKLAVRKVSDEVSGLWDSQASSVMLNPFPMLRELTLGSSARLRNIPSIVLENISSLNLVDYKNDEVIFSLSDVETSVGFVWRYSQLPRLEKLTVNGSVSLKELIKVDEYNGDEALEFCEQLKTLELSELPVLKHIPLHLFKGLESLTLWGINWEYVVSGETLGDSLQHLQFLNISSCDNMGAVVIDVVSTIELPRLKGLVLECLVSIKSFSRTTNGEGEREAILRLPSLESLVIDCCYKLEQFWSGLMVAPRLQRLELSSCPKMQEFLVGNTEFSSLQQVYIEKCKEMKSISSGILNAPKLQKVELLHCPRMEWFLHGSPNNNGVLELPYLKFVTIADSYKLHSFSLTPFVAPKLTTIEYSKKEYSMLPYSEDLNQFFTEMVAQHSRGNKLKELRVEIRERLTF